MLPVTAWPMNVIPSLPARPTSVRAMNQRYLPLLSNRGELVSLAPSVSGRIFLSWTE